MIMKKLQYNTTEFEYFQILKLPKVCDKLIKNCRQTLIKFYKSIHPQIRKDYQGTEELALCLLGG